MQPRQARLEIRLLGPMQVDLEGKPTAQLTADKVRALLAYLAVNPNQPHRREKLAGLLWPESPEASARASLRVALSKLRDAIDDRRAHPHRLDLSRQSVTFRPGQACHIDSHDFDHALQQLPDADGTTERTVEELTHLISLYHASFMEGFTLADCAEFEEWQTVQREHYHTSAVTALGRLADAFEQRGQLDEAIDLIRRQVALDPWREEGHRNLMALLASSGRRSEALAQYRLCRQVLATELGVEPDDATMALHRRIRDEAGLPQPQSAKSTPLPLPLTPLIGRERALADLAALLANPSVRLVTLLGPGGIGKTHLALVLAQNQQDRYPDGMAFVPFAPVHDADRFAVTVGQALGLSFYGEGSPKDQLFHHLQDKRLLLVLDNLEHLLAMREDIIGLLRASPHVTALCTSRRRLGVQGEHCYALDGLTMPDTSQSNETATPDAAALDLFVQSGRRSDPIFALTAENRAYVVAICRAVEGLPLGIILAASWLDMLSPAELASKIAGADTRWFDLLESDAVEMPPRHRSLRAVVESVWSMLSVHEQTIFATLSIFRGGFDAAAALAVANASLRDLRGLAAKSCLQVGSASVEGRYQIHEYLRQYGYEQLQAMADVEAIARGRHAAFFLAKLRDAEPGMKGHDQGEAIDSLAVDGENILAAWHWAADRAQVEALSHAIEPLCRFSEWQGVPLDGTAACRQVIETLASNETAQANRLLARADAWHALFSRLLGNQEEADLHEQRAMKRLGTLAKSGEPMEAERAHVLLCMGTNALYHDDLDAAEAAFRRSLNAFVAINDRWGQATALQNIAWTLYNRGEIRASLNETRRVLSVRRALGDTRGITESLMGLAGCYCALGDLEEGQEAAREELAYSQACSERRLKIEGVGLMAEIYLYMGQLEKSASHAWETLSLFEELGIPVWSTLEKCQRTSEISLHQGRYGEARSVLKESLTVARNQKIPWPLGAGLIRRAKVSLAESRIEETATHLAEAIPILSSIERLDELGDAYITLATCGMLQGDVSQARQHLIRGLQIAVDTEHYAMLCHGMAASALLASVEGDAAHAKERYVLAAAEPFVANSQWFAHVYGKRIHTHSPQSIDAKVDRAESASPTALRAAVRQVLAGQHRNDGETSPI